MTERIAYSQSEFCRAIGINRSTLWRWAQKGKIHFVEIGGRKFVAAGVTPGVTKLPQQHSNGMQHNISTAAMKSKVTQRDATD